MESFVNSLTAGNVQLSVPYAESLNNLVNYNSELTYSSSSSRPSQNQGTARLDISTKLPTKLSKNPSTYEKELRQIVIDLYSDKEFPAEEPHQLPDMSAFPGFPMVQEPGGPVVRGSGSPVVQKPPVALVEGSKVVEVQGPSKPIVQDTRGPEVQGPPLEGASHWGIQRVSAPQPLDMIRMTETSGSVSESGSDGYYSLDNSITPAEGSGIQSLQDLQGYLVKFQNSKPELPSRNVSFSSDLTTPLFDDSGIHLEFAMPFDTDISEEEGGGHGTDSNSSQGVEHGKVTHVRKELSGKPVFIIKEEGSESEAGDVAEPELVRGLIGRECSPSSEGSVLNRNQMILGNGYKTNPHLASTEEISKVQKAFPAEDLCSSVLAEKADGSFLEENNMIFRNDHGFDYIKRTDPSGAEDVLRSHKYEFAAHELCLEAPIFKADRSVLSKSKLPGDGGKTKADLAVTEDLPRVQTPFPGHVIPVVALSPETDASVLSRYDQEIRPNLTAVGSTSGMQKPPDKEKSQDFELQRASLEGKLESLQEEFANVLEDRKSLQIRLQAVEVRLKEEVQKARETKPTAVSLVDELRQNKCELENQLVTLQRAYEEKRDGLNDALERLKQASDTIENLKRKLLLVEGEICQREETVCKLQTEMDSLRKLLDQAKEQNEQFKKENLALNADIASLVDAKEWLQKQLKVAGEARMKMQLEASEIESSLAAKNRLIEQLRCDGARSNQQLAELQQSSLTEKAQILKHMEEVEEGITQQNLAFKELESEKQVMEWTLGAKVESLTSENNKLLKLVNSAVEIEKDLEAAKQDVCLKEALLDTIVKEKNEIQEQLKLARESTEEYKRNLSELESKFNETKQELKTAQDDIGEKQCCIQKLQEEKRILTANLEVANEERAACDNAIHMLRLDLEKVDRRFKLMKRELTVKKSQLEETTRQKDGFVGELRALREGLENQVNLCCAVKEELAQKEKLIEEFHEVKDALGKEIAGLTRQLEYSQDEIARVEKEKDGIQEQLQFTMREMVQLEEKFHQSLLEGARLEGELETTQQSNKDEIESLRSQNETLREQVKTEKIHLQTEVTRERDKVINLEQELKLMMDEMNRKESQYNHDLRAAGENLEQTKSRKEIVEQELKKLHEITEQSVVELKKTYERKLEGIQGDLFVLQEEKSKLEQTYDALQKKTANELGIKSREMSQMEKELEFLKGMLKQAKAEAEKMHLCAIELEREKGRLAGVLASQRTLRDHVVKMESEIASRESALLEMKNEMERLKREEEIQRKTASERIEMLETQLVNVRRENENIQGSFRKERQENATLKSKVEEQGNEQVEVMKKLGSAEKEIKQLQEKVKNESNEAMRCRSQLETVKETLVEEQTERENSQRRLDAVLEQAACKDSRVQSLEWELGRRTKEVEYLKEQLRIMEERQQLELENLKTALQVSRSETTSLRSDLTEARKTKCTYQTKTFELKDSLLTARQITESLKQELFVKRQELNSLLQDVLAARSLRFLQEEVTKKREAMGDYEEMRDDTDAANRESTSCFRPIPGLQECMSSLRSQISNLQKQMNDHTDSVLTATTSWRSFKENVNQLQASCTSQNSQLLTAEKDN